MTRLLRLGCGGMVEGALGVLSLGLWELEEAAVVDCCAGVMFLDWMAGGISSSSSSDRLNCSGVGR